MKKLLFVLILSLLSFDVSAQTKTAYCDVYMRGGYDCMSVTIMYDSDSHRLNRSYSIGEILNIMAEDGWVLDNDIVIPRHPFFSMFTRHKLHLIMKKEYNKGEDPFAFIKEFCSNKGYIEEVKSDIKEETIDNAISDELADSDITDDYTIIVSKCDSDGTWYDAVEYCKQLGEGWTLPNSGQMEYIINNYDIKFSSCWTNVEVNEKKAKAYYRGYTVHMMSTHKSSDNISIIAVKVAEKKM
jgi:hypothetical protein